jgi:DNA polymerase epsilon subunit 2
MLSQIKEDKIYLEDLDDRIELDLSDAHLSSGFFTETCFVLLLGNMMDSIFKVKELVHPPPESYDISRTIHGTNLMFGGTSFMDDLVRIAVLFK